jgi:hypothetical protein
MWWTGDVRDSHLELERAYAAYRRRGELRRSAALATRLSRVYLLIYGNASASAGWLARAERLLDEAGACPERGWFELMRVSGASPAEMQAGAQRAIEISRRFGDADLEILALAYLGLALVSIGSSTRECPGSTRQWLPRPVERSAASASSVRSTAPC